MAIVPATSGSPTYTGWKRRSRAASFSMCFWYSLRVVAPTQRSSPRASIGFSMFEASIEPSAAPAPTTVCSSSMNRMISPSDSCTSLSTAFRRSSNSPRYLAPAMSAPEVEGHQLLVLQRLGHVAGDDALGEALHDRGLADAGLADEHRVVLGAAGEHLHHAAHLVVAADDRVELALARQLGEVAAVLLERLVALLGVRVGRRAGCRGSRAGRSGATHRGRRPCLLEDLAAGVLLSSEGEEQVLGGDVLVLERLGLAQRLLEHAVEPRRELGGGALRVGEGAERACPRSWPMAPVFTPILPRAAGTTPPPGSGGPPEGARA